MNRKNTFNVKKKKNWSAYPTEGIKVSAQEWEMNRRRKLCCVDLCEMSWQTMNRLLDREHPASLWPRTSRRVSVTVYTSCWHARRSTMAPRGFPPLAVHSRRSADELRRVNTIHRLRFDKLSPCFKLGWFEGKCLLALLSSCASWVPCSLWCR